MVKASITINPGDIDPRLGRRYEPDPQFKDWPIRALLRQAFYETPKTRIWSCKTVLNQLNEGSCVGHGFAHNLIARPFPVKGITHSDAVAIYKKAQTLDDYPGDSYSGTSVLAGVKATQKLYIGSIESYRWAMTLADVVATIGYHAPVILGINWYSGMYNPDTDGFIKVSGDQVGGHCLLARGVDVKKNALLLRNSWGRAWGKGGDAWISYDDFNRLLHEDGEACVLVNHGWWRK